MITVETATTTSATSIVPIPASRGAAVTPATGARLAQLAEGPANIPFSVAEVTLVASHVTRSASRIGYDYDVTAAVGQQQPADGLVSLQSKNFGYAFALVHVDIGHGVFGLPKKAVHVYRSVLHADDYTCVHIATSVAKALRYVDQAYSRAAELHLA